MPLKSMTGFGRSEGATPGMSWVWEIRSVNGRGLDLRLRVPPGLEALEPKIREALQGRLTRGSVNISLLVKRVEGGSEIRVNEQAIKAVAMAVQKMREAIRGDTQVNIAGLLTLRGVLDYAEPIESEAEADTRQAAMLASLELSVLDFLATRAAEGQRLALVLADNLTEVETLVAAVAASPARTPTAIVAKLKDQVDRLLSQSPGSFDAARLHQEAMLIATRIDVEEELKRLTAHVAAARDLLAAKEPSGRKFDFLTQEFNREANTLCSKANDADMTRAGLALKAVIDQMREQVQNIE